MFWKHNLYTMCVDGKSQSCGMMRGNLGSKPAQHAAVADAASGPEIVGILTSRTGPNTIPIYQRGAAKRQHVRRQSIGLLIRLNSGSDVSDQITVI